MKFILPILAMLASSAAYAQQQQPTAGDMIAGQIGRLSIQNANQAEQITTLQAQIIELQRKLAEKEKKDDGK